MDTAITGITSVMAWCEDNMVIDTRDGINESLNNDITQELSM